MTEQLEPIPPQQAKQRLEQAIREHLGDNWDDEYTGWITVSRHDYMARLVKGKRQIDFNIDILGEISIEETETNPVQDMGRLMAWLFLLGSLVIAFIIARIAGFL